VAGRPPESRYNLPRGPVGRGATTLGKPLAMLISWTQDSSRKSLYPNSYSPVLILSVQVCFFKKKQTGLSARALACSRRLQAHFTDSCRILFPLSLASSTTYQLQSPSLAAISSLTYSCQTGTDSCQLSVHKPHVLAVRCSLRSPFASESTECLGAMASFGRVKDAVLERESRRR